LGKVKYLGLLPKAYALLCMPSAILTNWLD
jgi:hypothetical protein